MFEYIPSFMPGYFDLLQDLQRSRYRVHMFGRDLDVPREVGWVGDVSYTYSKITHAPAPWVHPVLLQVKSAVEERAGCVFNSCLISYYRDARDSVSWHADDEPQLGPEPTIASISFGATRRFQIRAKNKSWFSFEVPPRASRRVQEYQLADGDLIIMSGKSQQLFEHCVPKEKEETGPRLNLSFRFTHPLEAKKEAHAEF